MHTLFYYWFCFWFVILSKPISNQTRLHHAAMIRKQKQKQLNLVNTKEILALTNKLNRFQKRLVNKLKLKND
jgi:hypothetical protein